MVLKMSFQILVNQECLKQAADAFLVRGDQLGKTVRCEQIIHSFYLLNALYLFMLIYANKIKVNLKKRTCSQILGTKAEQHCVLWVH